MIRKVGECLDNRYSWSIFNRNKKNSHLLLGVGSKILCVFSSWHLTLQGALGSILVYWFFVYFLDFWLAQWLKSSIIPEVYFCGCTLFCSVLLGFKKISADIYKKNNSDLIRGFSMHLKLVLSDEKLRGSCLFS